MDSAAFRIGQDFHERTQDRISSQRNSKSSSEQHPERVADRFSDILIHTDSGVSSYTLLPLPALHTIQRSSHSDPISTPQRHQRSSSSLYYAAAWGSPYATPSPRRSTEGKNSSSRVASGCYRSERENWLSDGSENSEGDRQLARSTQRSGGSWLDLHSDDEQAALTPVAKKSAAQKSSPLESNLSPSFRRHHKGNDSLNTVKQESMDRAAKNGDSLQGSMKATMYDSETQNSMSDRYTSLRQASEKPLPQTPEEVANPSRSDLADASPRPKRRPSTTSGPSSQRQKKRVMCKGKACYIALPLDDERGRRPLLTHAGVDAHMEREGRDTRGFKLGSSPANEEFAGQTCRLYPDPVHVMEERERGQFRVSVPNQAEWDAYVKFLNEEKLRALGVTLNDNDHPRSTLSPFPPTISRASSRLPVQSLSPPVPTLSAASNIPHPDCRSFSPALHASNTSSRVGSVASFLPQFAPQNGTHRSDKSLVYSTTDSRITSPFNPYPLHPTPPLQRDFSPSVYFAQRYDRFSTPGAGISYQQLQRSYTGTTPLNHFPAHSMRPSDEQEIVHPAPQGHQRNISEALQNEIDAAEEIVQSCERYAPGPADPTQLNVMENTSPLYSGAERRDSNSLHTQPPKLAAAVGESVSRGIVGSKFIASEPGSNRLPYNTNHRMLDKRNSEETLLSQRTKGVRGHRPTSSVSKLNVAAEEFKFNPRDQFSSSNFVFNGNAFQPSLPGVVPSYANNALSKTALSASITISGLNVDAPSFTPSTFSKGDFQFNSATFNVGAPVFNPGQTVSKSVLDQNVDVDAADASDKIFTNVTIDPTGKATRRGKFSKALPIRQPDDGEHTEDDEDGRVRVSAARQKRARVQGHHCDDTPQYATATPVKDDDVRLISSEIASKSPDAVVGGNENAARVSSSADSSSIIVTEEDHKQSLEEGYSSEAVRLPLETQASSSQPDLNIVQGEEEAVGAALPGERSVTGDGIPQNANGADYLSSHHATVSLSALLLSNAADDRSSDASSTTSKPRKLAAVESSDYAATPPSSPPATNTPNDPLPQQSDFEHRKVSLSSEPAEECDAGSDNMQSHDEATSTAAENTAPAVYSDDDEHQAPPSDVLSSTLSSSAERDGTVPSYNEIDAVMKQLEDNSDLGVERVDTPPMQSMPAGGLFLNPSINIRSDAPSPSPKRTQITLEPAYQSEETRMPVDQFPSGIDSERPGFSINRVEGGDISDWNDTLSVADEAKFEKRTQFFGTHVNNLVGGIVDDRLATFERRLETIQHSIALLAPQSHRSRRIISTSDEVEHSDADDEDEDTNSGSMLIHRTRSPINHQKEPSSDIVKTAVMEALAAYKQESLSSREMDQSAFEQLLSELRALKDSSMSQQSPGEIKAVVEEVISTHPRLRGKRVQEDHQAGLSQKFGLQIDGFESLLKIADERTQEEYRARRKVEDDLAETERRLSLMAEEAAQYREASEEAECSLRTYYEEKESIQELEQSYSEILLKNAALETTLEEYRLSHDQWRIDIEDECKRNSDLKAVLQSLRREVEENSQTKQGLRAKLEHVQDDMADVMERVAQDQASWLRKEHEHSAQNKELEAELHRETRMRQKMELELDELQQDRKELSKFRDAYDLTQRENTRLEALVTQTRQESRTYEDAAHQLKREVDHLREIAEAEASRARSIHDHDISLLRSQHNSVTADLEGQVSRLHAQLQQARDDAEETKSNHQSHLDDQSDRHGRALHEVNETKEAALAEQRRSHEKAINDLRERHARALHNASDDKHRLEANFTEKLALGSDKIQHLEEKVTDLQHRLEITSSAARAAAVAAAGKGTPESGSHPIPLANAASMPLVGGSGIPGKISPQALRESIMVLQDQLQNREQTIELLQADLAKVDKDAPTKVKDRETEIAWLRELLGLRIDDLEEIIKALCETDYDREAVRDAVIRLKANLEMEQQEKERAVQSMPGVFPSMASLSNLTQTPRALPMAAAAAWGNWRKARDTSLATLSDPANMNDQTPSRPSASPQSFLSGLLTPPRTSQRQTTPPGSAPPTTKTLNGRKSSSEARPLRAYSSQARSMSARQVEKRPLRRQQSSEHAHSIVQQQQQQIQQLAPSTPPLTRDSGYDMDADARRSIMSDLDDDASPVGSGIDGGGSSLGEPFDESAR